MPWDYRQTSKPPGTQNRQDRHFLGNPPILWDQEVRIPAGGYPPAATVRDDFAPFVGRTRPIRPRWLNSCRSVLGAEGRATSATVLPFPGSRISVRMLLTITGALEAGTGLALAIAPSWIVQVLLGSPLDSPASLVIGRVLGAALFSLGAACWLARGDARGRTTEGLITAMLLYNTAVVSLLGYAHFGLAMSGVGGRPVIILHAALGVWCLACILISRQNRSYGT
jgi:hypothetical protein